MKFNYDPAVDALYVRLNDKKIIESEEIKPGIVLDYDEFGNVAGIEVLNASKHGAEPMKKAA